MLNWWQLELQNKVFRFDLAQTVTEKSQFSFKKHGGASTIFAECLLTLT
jgi:hypothetical protein